MRDVAKYGTWGGFLGSCASPSWFCSSNGLITNGPVLSNTVRAFPIAVALTAATFYAIKRHWSK